MEQLNAHTTFLQQVEACVAERHFVDKERSALGLVRQFELPKHTRERAAFEIVQQTEHTIHETKRREGSRQGWRIRFSPWFATQVWEISFLVAQSGFNFNVRTCNFVSDDAVIFEACRGGDIEEVKALFQSGEASPFDCSYNHGNWPLGVTVLAVRSTKY